MPRDVSGLGLMQLSTEQLDEIAKSSVMAPSGSDIEGAMPPPHVARRIQAQLAAGTPAEWCLPYWIIVPESGAILGSCGFKGVPLNGEVEIGYGVAIKQRGCGVATRAVVALLKMAVDSGEVLRVVANILPDNLASTKVVSRLGFVQEQIFVDSDGESLARWVYSLESLLVN